MNNIHGMPTPFYAEKGNVCNGEPLPYGDAFQQAKEHGFDSVHDFVIALERDGLNGYLAYYKGKKIEVWAKTTYEAQTIACGIFKAKRQRDVDVMLCIKDGKQIEWTSTL
jgi:hypothetical protein